MKISGKFILKVAGTLTVISLVVAALLGLVDNVTADKIAAIDAENTRIAMSAVAPEGSEFGDKLDITDDMTAAAASQGGKLVELYPMTTAGADNGYVMKISASGSQGSIVMMVGVDADKAITGISVVSHAETSGIGTKVMGNDPTASGVGVLDQFIGKSAADGTLTVGTNVDAITGATVSTRGVTTGVNTALALRLGLRDQVPLAVDGTDEAGRPYGVGRVGQLEGGPMTVDHFARRAKETLGLSGIRVLDAGVPVQRVAVGGGACGSMLPQVRAMGCDTFLTADLKHDLYLEAREAGMNLLDAGHYSTEAVVCPVIAQWVREAFPDLWVEVAENQGEVFEYF